MDLWGGGTMTSRWHAALISLHHEGVRWEIKRGHFCVTWRNISESSIEKPKKKPPEFFTHNIIKTCFIYRQNIDASDNVNMNKSASPTLKRSVQCDGNSPDEEVPQISELTVRSILHCGHNRDWLGYTMTLAPQGGSVAQQPLQRDASSIFS